MNNAKNILTWLKRLLQKQNEQQNPASITKKTNIKCRKNKRKLTLSEVFNITRTKHIKTKCELYALAETQRKEG